MEREKVYYFDYNATTPVAPEVVEAMLPVLRHQWGNPSSPYGLGKTVASLVEHAREQVAALIHAEPREIIFTSGGTESINSVLHAALVTPGKNHIITTAVEHSASLRYCDFLRKRGIEVSLVPVREDGSLVVEELRAAIRPTTALVSVMWANNETGVVYPVAEVAALCRERGVIFHTDAVQAAGKLSIDVPVIGADFVSLSAHKIYGPKGIGALYFRQRGKFQPYLMGGHQEHGRRGGTENVPGIVGFGRAAELARERVATDAARVSVLRDRLEGGLLKAVAGVTRNGAAKPRLPNTTNLSFGGVEAEAILIRLDQLGICVSTGSACTTGSPEPSHVLRAMGISLARARSALRFSLGRYTTVAEVDYVLEHLPRIVAELHAVLPLR